MLRTALLLSIVCLFAFASCKKTGPTKACFNFSKDKVKVGDTVYLLNCSENYNKFIWIDLSGLLDSVNRHTYMVPGATGTYDVFLYVGPNEFTSANYGDASVEKKSLIVE
ncbi:MAG: hypothetical protein IT257_09840 [Chitinophagaceae bacterium]|nr:hypothetical protein [Chitinophagaceae bacterium]